jgi:hypothetical protein
MEIPNTGSAGPKNPPRKIRLFVDESGDFSSPGHHLIAALCHMEDGKGRYQNLLEIVESCFTEFGCNYRNFHATGINSDDKKKIFTGFAQKLGEEKLSVYINSVVLSRKAAFDFYFPLLVSSVLEVIDHQTSIHDRINLEIFLEDRSSANNKLFCDIIREKCLSRKIVVPSLRVLNFPKGENAMISLVDLFSNMYFNDIANGSNFFKTSLAHWDTLFFKQDESAVRDKKAKKIYERISTGKIIRINPPTKKTIAKKKIITKIVEKQGKTIVVHDNSTVSGRLINEFNHQFRKKHSGHKLREIFEAAHQKLCSYSPADRLHEVEKLIDVYEMLYEKREFELAVDYSAFITFHLEKEIETDDKNRDKLKWLYIKNSNQWLAAQNHMGAFHADHPVVKQAEAYIQEFIEYSDCWSEIADFYNHISVSLQNIFEFEKAAERIQPYVEYFSNLTVNPFGKGSVAGRYIGGLFGSYSQALFFDCHCSHYYTKGARFEALFDQAISYSELSEIFFDDPEDTQRQHTYRAHGYMQRFILRGDHSALETAECQLSEIFDREALCKAFFSDHNRLGSNELYALSAFLKLEWLSNNPGTFLPGTRQLMKTAGKLPARHPYEQILGYLILLKAKEGTMSDLMQQKKWPGNIIQIIAMVFCLQIEWEKNHIIDPDILDKITTLPESRFMANWKRYGIIEQLTDMKRPDYDGIGPLSVLPYNYA